MKNPAVPGSSRREPIEDQVLVALRRIIRSIDIHSRALVKHYGLTGPQAVVLQEISKHDEITPGRLADAVSLSQATISGILERLNKRGFITRRRSESDRRRVLIRSTPEADQMLEKGPPIMQLSFVRAFNGLEEWEQTMILSSLQRLVTLMDAEDLKSSPMLTTDSLIATAAASSAKPSEGPIEEK
jgi:DNA-binding MarR family transcriptional regulator